MGNRKRERERIVSQLVADQINKERNTDYRAELCYRDPPDVVFKSDSGSYDKRYAEVVSTQQDFTIRRDNDNLRSCERKLRFALEKIKVCGYSILVNWSDSALRYGVKNNLIARFAALIKECAPNAGHLRLSGVEIYNYDAALAEIVWCFRIFRLCSAELQIGSVTTWWGPHDGIWIQQAVERKSNKYSRNDSGRWILIVDGLAHLNHDQIAAFRATSPSLSIPFAEIWVVTMGKAYRVSPASREFPATAMEG